MDLNKKNIFKALKQIPVFPLPNMVFFPNTILPLFVFEDRYKKLVADVLNTQDKLLSIVLLKPGWEKNYFENPPVYSVAGLGRIVQSETLPDGKYNILLQGISRIKIVDFTQVSPYRIAKTEILREKNIISKDLDALFSRLVAYCWELTEDFPEARELLKNYLVTSSPDAGVLADITAHYLNISPEQKQQVLNTVNVIKRLKLINNFAAEVIKIRKTIKNAREKVPVNPKWN